MRQIIVGWIVFSLVVASIASSGASAGSTAQKTDTQNVTVSIHNALCSKQGKVDFDWVIKNSENKPVYIYATFLKSHAVSLDFDEVLRLITVWTSRAAEAEFAVNAYPRARFLKLRPGAVLHGHFTDSPKRYPAIINGTQLAFAIAFGQSTESVENALREGHYVHPANPIVEWQQVAKSAPVPLRSCNLK